MPLDRVHSRDRRRKFWVVVLRDGLRCWLCRQWTNPMLPRDHGHSTTLDHVIPTSRGGSNATANLKVACRGCNKARADGLPPGWRQRVKFQRRGEGAGK